MRGAKPVFCSWSGGKDCALALDEAVRAGADTRLLVTMMTETGARSRSHGLSREVLEGQADAVGVPIVFGSATWDGYEAAFEQLVRQAVSAGAPTGVFGDIDVDSHREWVRSVCSRGGSTPVLPLWGREREDLLEALVARGFQAMIIAVKHGRLPREFLGEVIDRALVRRLGRYGIDLSGEQGEYHTLVVDGPLFQRTLAVRPGEPTLRDGVWFLDVTLARGREAHPVP